MTHQDPLTTRLRDEARAFAPQPPAGVRRRIMSALAAADATPAAPRTMWRISAISAAGLAIVAVVVAVTVRQRPAPPQVVRGPLPTHAQPVLPPPTFAFADPVSLAHRYLDAPIENEVENVLVGLSRARDTVVRVLPAPSKRPGPATRPPAGA
jgi:hypothetical protein